MKKITTQVHCPFCDTPYVRTLVKPRPCEPTPFELVCAKCESVFQCKASKIMGPANQIAFDFEVIHRGAIVKYIMAAKGENARR